MKKNKINHEFQEGELSIGRYEVLEKISDSIYKIDTDQRKSESKLLYITKLIPAQPSPDRHN